MNRNSCALGIWITLVLLGCTSEEAAKPTSPAPPKPAPAVESPRPAEAAKKAKSAKK